MCGKLFSTHVYLTKLAQRIHHNGVCLYNIGIIITFAKSKHPRYVKYKVYTFF